ncbi:MAG: hypothetical protein EYC62_02540 [Alphaproteobacteria bacterium]|nr:MAG: hypothetical protein EYC62_02540 [Alphaproteobacteria bacterium]
MRKTYVYRNGKLQLKNEEDMIPNSPNIIADLKPYKSMVTGETIDGRAAHRAHLRQHGCIEVGD